MKEYWEAKAEYADGTRFSKKFAYYEGGNYQAECDRQYDLETWLLERHEGCTWYSVDYVAE